MPDSVCFVFSSFRIFDESRVYKVFLYFEVLYDSILGRVGEVNLTLSTIHCKMELLSEPRASIVEP